MYACFVHAYIYLSACVFVNGWLIEWIQSFTIKRTLNVMQASRNSTDVKVHNLRTKIAVGGT